MKRYKSKFIEQDIEDKDDTQELAKQEYENLITKLKDNTFRNKEMRIEFAKIIMSLASCQYPLAKKLIWKMGEFANYWQNDEMIDEKEWYKLNQKDFKIDN